jgi:hypothetical protein
MPYATALLAVTKLLKSQCRLTNDDICELVPTDVRLLARDRKNVFVKIHHRFEHVIEFIKRHRMFGRISKEGSEAVHPQVNDISKQKNASMVNLEDRTRNF